MDMDYSTEPYSKFSVFRGAVRSVRYHPRLPLLAFAIDDGRVHVYHGQVSDDLNVNAQITPLKILKAHVPHSSLGALDIAFHPHQPWLFTAGADNDIHCWT